MSKKQNIMFVLTTAIVLLLVVASWWLRRPDAKAWDDTDIIELRTKQATLDIQLQTAIQYKNDAERLVKEWTLSGEILKEERNKIEREIQNIINAPDIDIKSDFPIHQD